MEKSYNNAVRTKPAMFASLEFEKSRGRSLWTSLGVHGFLLTVLLVIPLLMTDQLKLKHYDVWMLAPPPPPKQVLEITHYKLPEPPKEKPIVAPPPTPVVKQPVPAPPKPEPKPEPKPLPKPEIVNIPKVASVPKLPEPEPIKPAPAPAPKIVKTDVFSSSPPPTPTTNLPARQVQTGGFGDPNGIRGDGRADKPANIASLGSFDLPVGPGAGNGTGGARGKAGVVASTGFGGSITDSKPDRAGNGRQAVREGGFGDATAAAPSSGGARPAQRAAGPAETPAEILFKPKPDYTEDARRAKTEGEVLLRVLFTAGGEVRVLDTISGLGHGLDENAVKSARQIRFKPAMRDGKPVDFTAVVHIVFQLAN